MRNQDMLHPVPWTAPDFLSLSELHLTLLHTYHSVEGPRRPNKVMVRKLPSGLRIVKIHTDPLSLLSLQGGSGT